MIYSPGSAGSDSGSVQITAAGYSLGHTITLNGNGVTELWTPMERFTSGDLVDLHFNSTSQGWAIQSRGLVAHD